ncbi:unnamed protein product [Cyprideis torosa]|uniref:Uncharacterized protein n=1 Tax=Cyprideis torosa TaxID=163714 RepID=A0A7R8WWU6_9CRUS|nr:unnamed protein product [Cyprideis torosa]CAG0908744.1 unnamed protein product [Cyprideis torosa]
MVEEMNEPLKFSGIAALYSELVAVTRDGVLCQWKWSSRTPHFDRTQVDRESDAFAPFPASQDRTSSTGGGEVGISLSMHRPPSDSMIIGGISFVLQSPPFRHPKTGPLRLEGEKVTLVAAASIRCSVATSSGKVATFFDESVDAVARRMEQTATAHPELTTEEDLITELKISPLFTCARLASGELFWW